MAPSSPVCCVCRDSLAAPFETVEGRAYWRCPVCEAVFLEPSQRVSPDEERACYLLHENHVDDPGYRSFLSQIADPLLAALAEAQEGLDYGCGPGPALAAMLTEGGHTMSLYDPLFFPQRGNLDRPYDFIVCTETAEHFHDPHAEFDRLSSLLRPGGCIAIMTRFLPDGQNFAQWHYRRESTHVVFYRPATFQRVADQRALRCQFPARNVVLLWK